MARRVCPPRPHVRAPRIRWWALGAVAGPLVFTVGWLVLGFVSPGYTVGGDFIAPYSPVTQPISGLGMGETALAMNAVFVFSGLLLLAGVIGVFRSLEPGGRPAAHWTCAALLALSPVGLVVAGFFDLERPVPHLAGFLLITATPVVTFGITGLHLRGIPGWRRFGGWLIAGSPVVLVLLVSFFLTFGESTVAENEGVAGLVSRLLGLAVHVWFAALGWLAFVRAAPATASAAPVERSG